MKASRMAVEKGILVIMGTTGVGKSQLSIELAKRFNGEVINGDSIQMYRGLDNITNKHPIQEREGIRHHLLGHKDWTDKYNLNEFEKEAHKVVDDIHARGKLPIFVGGTTYYLSSFMFKNSSMAEEIPETKLITPEQRKILASDPATLFQELKRIDPIIAEKFHPNDTRRIQRCLEIAFSSGKPTSEIYQKQRSELHQFRYPSLVFWIWSDQGILDTRLNTRVDKMIENGLDQEIDELYDYYKAAETKPNLTSGVFQAIGYKEFIPWLDLRESSSNSDSLDTVREQCINDMKTATRRYARYQQKWIRNRFLPTLCEASESSDSSMCGYIYLLDSSDLSRWQTDVIDFASTCMTAFLGGTALPKDRALDPEKEKELLGASEKSSFYRHNPEGWAHFRCQICEGPRSTSSSGEERQVSPSDEHGMLIVGLDAWKDHLKSRRHKLALRRIEKRKAYHAWLAKKAAERQSENYDS